MAMKLLTIVGARPQFIKAAAVSAKISDLGAVGRASIEEVIVHTGQHYDAGMSEIFFRELGIPSARHNLAVGSGSHAVQTAAMLEGLEKVMVEESPGMALVYGDTNSTLSGALAASKLHIPVAHVEAGMRSFNRNMPEEINRIVADHLASLNLCPSLTSMDNLAREGLEGTSVLTGDIMYDCALKFAKLAEKLQDPLSKFSLHSGRYALMTCHRAENTDNCMRISQIVSAANELSQKLDVVFPIHPRTGKMLESFSLSLAPGVKTLPPLGYLDMLLLEKHAAVILTDSGGVQKEAFFFSVPCITMRDETEWVETVQLGFNVLVGADGGKILSAVEDLNANPPHLPDEKPYGNGDAADKIISALCGFRP
ncbi:MAG: UDP-N-acetylglucosamine 2-epimerase (non-hydrolyzing) [Victivallales bacterium]|nr:UDP-N-acetylglucosamine 2-epimerase (non-hydrolyzing) [Victivallales bacterium]